MKKIFSILLFLAITTMCFAEEPGTNLGKTLAQIKSEFPDLRFFKETSKGTEYIDGDPSEGIVGFFTFRSNRVVEECFIVQSDNGFARDWYNSLVNKFSKHTIGFGHKGPNEWHWVYSTFTAHIIYGSENGINTTMVVYNVGGYNTGVTREKFYRDLK